MLRARAYGPSADIHDDPAALRRLRELEAQAAPPAPSPTSHAAAPTVSPAPEAAPPVDESAASAPLPPLPTVPAATAAAHRRDRLTEPTVTIAGASEAATPAPDGATAPRRWLLSPGFALLWLVSLIAVAAVAAGVTLAATWIAPIAQHADARQIATLSPDPAFDWPKALGDRNPDMASDGYAFHGLTVIRMTQPFDGSDKPIDCLLAYVSGDADADAEYFPGPVYNGCGAGSFAPTVQLRVEKSMPAELKKVAPAGTSLQFVLDGDRIGVFSDAD
jgi:hypothetical protein